jgi:nicotinamidase/pyrazinamidase
VWPAHCVRDTPGAQLHPGIDSRQIDVVLDKGRDAELEGYSGFEGTELERLLRDRGVDAVDVAGLALDYCVKATALDARRAGFEVTVHRGATRAVEVSPGDSERAVKELRAAGVSVVD